MCDGWWRLTGCLKLQVIFRKRATNHRALLRKTTCNDKASYGSLPPCTPHCNTLRRTAIYCTTLMRCTAIYCTTLTSRPRGQECMALKHTATHCNTLQHTVLHCNTLQHTEAQAQAQEYRALQHTGTHCNALQHTATH